MDIQDVMFNPDAPFDLKIALLHLMDEHRFHGGYVKLLVPTATNDDVNGSQHNSNGGTDFTYRDATQDDLDSASMLGYYEYFSAYGAAYTGHYYEGDGRHFDAVVLDPPAYAATQDI